MSLLITLVFVNIFESSILLNKCTITRNVLAHPENIANLNILHYLSGKTFLLDICLVRSSGTEAFNVGASAK